MTEMRAATHAAEGGHWYSRDGQQIAEVDGKKPTLREARKHLLVPGVTTILRMADRPQLNTWREEQAMLAAMTLPRLAEEPEEAWLARVREDSKETARKAADEGTRIHAAVESHFRDGTVVDGYERHVAGVAEGLRRWIPDKVWEPERVVVSPAGYGTKIDLRACGDGPMGKGSWIINLKGKDGSQEVLQRLGVYDEHRMQLGAERNAAGIDFMQARCLIWYVSRTHPGAHWPVEVKDDDLRRGFEMFCALLTYWKKKHRYESGWTPNTNTNNNDTKADRP